MAFLARLLIYPTLLWNLLLRRLNPRRHWWDWIDEHVLLGAMPFKSDVAELHRLGIRAVVNTCDEYKGPLAQYKAAGIEQLYIPTVDYIPPTLENIEKAVAFIDRAIGEGKKVFIHCKAGRGRSATVVACYLIAHGNAPEEAQEIMVERRPHVLATVCQREVVQEFARRHGRA
jgi:atypical dual specificity phosphatase